MTNRALFYTVAALSFVFLGMAIDAAITEHNAKRVEAEG